MGGMNVLMVRNYFNANVPYSIVEAAQIDGAGVFSILAHNASTVKTCSDHHRDSLLP